MAHDTLFAPNSPDLPHPGRPARFSARFYAAASAPPGGVCKGRNQDVSRRIAEEQAEDIEGLIGPGGVPDAVHIGTFFPN